MGPGANLRLSRPDDPVTLSRMEWSIVGLNFLYAALGVVLMYLAYRAFDFLTPKVSFEEELKHGNVAVAIFLASIFISIAIIIGGALN